MCSFDDGGCGPQARATGGSLTDTTVNWQRFVDDASPDDALRPLILHSWRRSRSAGVQPRSDRYRVERVSADDLSARVAANAVLIEVARPHLEWLSDALAARPHVAYVVDADGIVLDVAATDDPAVRALGLEPGSDWSEAAMGTNGPGTALSANEPVSINGAEHFMAALHGVWCISAPIRGADGQAVGAIGVSTAVHDGDPARLLTVSHAAFTIERDLAHRASMHRADRELESQRRLADALSASERRMRALLDANVIGVAVSDLESVLEANDEFLRVSGTTREQFDARGVNWRALTPPEHLPRDLNALQQIIEHGACTPFEKDYVWPDGTRVPLLIGAARVEQDPLQWIAFTVDLTKRNRAEARLRLLQELTVALSAPLTYDEIAEVVVSRVLESLGADGGALLIRDPDGETCRIVRGIGYSDDANQEWVDRPIPIVARMPVTAPFRTGEPEELESLAVWRIRYPDVAPFHERYGYEALTTIPCVLDGEVLGALALSFRSARLLTDEERDFGLALARQCAHALERARLYEAERRARAEAEAASRAKSEFLNVVSHELRTPLNAIAGYAQLMQLGIPDVVTPAQENYLARIVTAQRHLLSLVNNVLNLAKIEAGHVDYELGRVPVNELWSAVEPLVAPQLRAKGLGYHVAPCDPRLTVRADREKALQVLLNLVTNAIKFTPSGGHIALDAEAGDDVVAIRIRDTGVGIAEEKLATVFDPFVQVDTSMTRTSEGVGLGLAISRQLARGMDGDLTVASIVEEGSTFTLTLPRGD